MRCQVQLSGVVSVYKGVGMFCVCMLHACMDKVACVGERICGGSFGAGPCT